MAHTNRLFKHLSERIDISPAGTEEELQAAKSIEALMENAGLATTLQEFETNNPSSLIIGLCYLFVFLGAFIAGFGGLVGVFVGFVLLILGVLGLYSKDAGKEWLGFLGKKTRSQNVIGFHKGCGPSASSSARKIVLVAHYDSGHEELLANPKLARYAKFFRSAAPLGILIASVATVLELIVAFPSWLLVLFWIVAFVAAIPALVLGINGIVANFSALTGAANDNNASLAALLGVALDVSAHGATVLDENEETGQEEEDKEYRPKSVPGSIRHGAKMIEELAILPSSCQIDYVEGDAHSLHDAQFEAEKRIHEEVEKDRVHDEEARNATGAVPLVPVYAKDDSAPSSQINEVAKEVQEKPAEQAEGDSSSTIIEVPEINPSGHLADVQQNEPRRAIVLPDIEPFSEPPVSPFEPLSQQNPGQRAALFDLPDPEENVIDPLSSSFDMPSTLASTPEQDVQGAETSQIGEASALPLVPANEGRETHNPYQKGKKKAGRLRKGHFGADKKESQEDSMSDWLGVDQNYDAKSAGRKISSWDNFDDEGDDFWKGGATRTDAFKEELGEATQGELADAVLSMDEANLIGHDIYFVATGASTLDHAGMYTFLKEHKKDLRGAYVLSLDAIGAGELTVFAQERIMNPKKATRRILKTVDRVARDLHIGLMNAQQAWTETETTAALASGVRGVSIVGCEPGEVPALARTKASSPQNVDTEQIAQVNRLLDESIRRL